MVPLVVLVVLQSAGAESTVSQRIDRARILIAQLEYEEASDELQIALGDPAATEEERVEANLLAGIVHRVVGRNVEARLNFRYVLQRAPDTKLPPQTPPKIASFYDLVRTEVEAEQAAASGPRSNAEAPGRSDVDGEPDGGPLHTAMVIGGVAFAGLGAALVVVGLAAAAATEIGLAVEPVPGATKDALFWVGWLALGVAVVGLVPIVAGGSVAAAGLLE